MPQMKHGGKAHKKMAKGGACKADAVKAVHRHERKDHPGTKLTKLGHGGALAKMRRGEMSPDGEPSGKHGHGVNGIGQKKHGGKVKKMAFGGAVGEIKRGGSTPQGNPESPPVRSHGKEGVGESMKHGGKSSHKGHGKILKKSMGGDIQTGRANRDGSPSEPHIVDAKSKLVTPKFKGKNAVGGG